MSEATTDTKLRLLGLTLRGCAALLGEAARQARDLSRGVGPGGLASKMPALEKVADCCHQARDHLESQVTASGAEPALRDAARPLKMYPKPGDVYGIKCEWTVVSVGLAYGKVTVTAARNDERDIESWTLDEFIRAFGSTPITPTPAPGDAK